MGFKGPLLNVDVGWAADIALVKVENRHGHVVKLHVSGQKGSAVVVSIPGNQKHHQAYTVPEELTIRSDDEAGTILYQGQPVKKGS